jgi:hypothetical protein
LTESLKPCPFCGDKARIEERQDESLFSHDIVTWYWVQCSNTKNVDTDCPAYDGSGSEVKEEVVEAWNRRAERCKSCQELRRRIQQLESQLAKAEKAGRYDPWAGRDREKEAAERDRAMEAIGKAEEREK